MQDHHIQYAPLPDVDETMQCAAVLTKDAESPCGLVLWTPDIDATSYLSGCGKCALLSFYDRHRLKLTAPLLFICVCICLPILPSSIREVLSLNCYEYQDSVAVSPVCEQVTNTMSEHTWRDHNSDDYEEKAGFCLWVQSTARNQS